MTSGFRSRMGDVHQIGEALPHTTGPAVCLHCETKWTAVIPAGDVTVKCPHCELMKGVREGIVMPNLNWVCNCGSELFYVLPDNQTLCPLCGTVDDHE